MSIMPPTPTIEIHFASDEVSELQLEIQAPKSPFSPKHPSPMYNPTDDGPRSVHLLPPPVLAPTVNVTPKLPADKKGIDQERFAQLLKSSRERAAMKHGRKESLELRKQVTMKAHTTKALERRALFLSKVGAQPEPDSVESPATPPESPAIFHFKLPSPGMRSPLSIENKVAFPSIVVEEVDFKARHTRRTSGGAGVPSLDMIAKRMHIVAPLATNPNRRELPASVLKHRRTPSSPLATSPVPSVVISLNDEPEKKDPPVNRLPAFLLKRTASASASTPEVKPIIDAPPPSSKQTRRRPSNPIPPPIITTPFHASLTPQRLPIIQGPADIGNEQRVQKGRDMVERLRRRSSAPACAVIMKERHKVLDLKGGF